MLSIKRTRLFDAWLANLGDAAIQSRLLLRLRKAQLGTLGEVKPVGQGVFEMREPVCPAWRMYYTQRRGVLVFMHGGSDDSQQLTDIAAAQAVAAALNDSDQEE
jgi:putative addiction module killer protein